MLAIQQKEVGDAIAVSQTLYWFASEAEASDFSSGSAIDLAEVDAILTEPLPLQQARRPLAARSYYRQMPDGSSTSLLKTARRRRPTAAQGSHDRRVALTARRHCVNAEGTIAPPTIQWRRPAVVAMAVV